MLKADKSQLASALPVVYSFVIILGTGFASGRLTNSLAAALVAIFSYILLSRSWRYAVLLLPIATAWAISNMPLQYVVMGSVLGFVTYLWLDDHRVYYFAALIHTVVVMAVSLTAGGEFLHIVFFVFIVGCLLSFKQWLVKDAAERIRQTEQFRDLTVQGYGHEFRTPLTNIQNGYRQLAGSALDSRQRAWLDDIGKNVESMTLLSNNAIDFISSVTGSSNKAQPQAIFVPDAIRSFIDTSTVTANVKGLYLRCFFEGDVQSVMTDPQVLRTAIPNLVSNALKFTTAGGVSVLGRTYLDEGQLYLSISVVDTGPGVPDEAIPKLFNEFVSMSHTEGYRSSGLGLRVAAQVVKTVGGTITHRNRSDGGAIFTVSIPVSSAPTYTFKPRGLKLAIIVTDNTGFIAEAEAALVQSGVLTSRVPATKFNEASASVANRSDCVLILDANSFAASPIRLTASLPHDGKTRTMLIAGEGIIWSTDLASTLVEAAFSAICRSVESEGILAAIHAARVMTVDHRSLAEVPSVAATRTIRVLLAEDDATMRSVWRTTLSMAGVAVTAVARGDEAIAAMATRDDYDIAVLDFNLPGANADDIVAARRNFEADGDVAKLPVIIMTAEYTDRVDNIFGPSVVETILRKPLSEGQLVRAVYDALSEEKQFHEKLEATAPVAANDESEMPIDFRTVKRDGLLNLLAEATKAVSANEPLKLWAIAHKMRAIVCRDDEALLCLLREPAETEFPDDEQLWLEAVSDACHNHVRTYLSA
jgi:signal transduction histidine kinase/DNA-binding response OmpR family regulator